MLSLANVEDKSGDVSFGGTPLRGFRPVAGWSEVLQYPVLVLPFVVTLTLFNELDSSTMWRCCRACAGRWPWALKPRRSAGY